MNRNKSILVVLFAIVLATAACGRDEGRPGTTAAGQRADVTVHEIQLGNQVDMGKSITTPMEVFNPSDTVYVSVRTSGVSAGTRLTARWTYEGGQVVDETSETISTDGVTEFHISKPDGWPAGNYRVDILVNGVSKASKNFQVR